MRLDLKASQLDLTPALREYVEEKIGSLAKFLTRWEREGEAAVWVEVDRVTRHHLKGKVFRAAADVKLPNRLIRAEAHHADARAAIDELKDKLKAELTRYKDRVVRR